MANDGKFTIKIESILGGHAPTTHFAAPDQFRTSIGIDPSLPINDEENAYSIIASGLLRPVGSEKVGTEVLTHAPMWIISTPKDSKTYVYDYKGSVYTALDGAFGTDITTLGDLTDGGTAQGNGAAYYDNYMYFARSTTVARYGPLDGTPSFTDDYWVTTLGKTALTDQQYPNDRSLGFEYPNHVLHRHSDGKLYIADVVGNRGTIHFISTTKITTEGDTDNGSTYAKVQVGYNFYPTAIESYGSDLVVALSERRAGNFNAADSTNRAKLVFWDTTSTNVNKITSVEFPDPFISALKNVNGVLYVISGGFNDDGYRISRFVGGYTVEEVYYSEVGQLPMPGAVDGNSNRIIFGSRTLVPEDRACVFSYGLQKSLLGQGVFNVMGATATTAGAVITSLMLDQTDDFSINAPVIGWTTEEAVGAGKHGIDRNIRATNSAAKPYDPAPQVWWSQMFRIGQPFKITKIRMPFASAIGEGVTVTPTLYTDEGSGTSYPLATINNINDSGKRNVIRRAGSSGETILGQHNFWLGIKWTGSALATVGLPITIEGEILDD